MKGGGGVNYGRVLKRARYCEYGDFEDQACRDRFLSFVETVSLRIWRFENVSSPKSCVMRGMFTNEDSTFLDFES